MKKIVWLIFLGFILGVTGLSQTSTVVVTGVVFNHSNPVPLPVLNQEVDILVDSTGTSFFYQNTVLTDSAGFFTDEITLPPEVLYGFVTVSTYDTCLGTDQYQVAVFGQGAQLPPFDFFLCQNIPLDCMAMFFWDVDPTLPLTVQFTDMSWGTYDSWLWDFGDGNTSTEPNPVHTYADGGLYQVCLTISDSAGFCNNTGCDYVQVGQYPAGCDNFFFYEQVDILTYTFTGEVFWNDTLNSYQTDYFWDFGDGTTGNGQTITHTFQVNPAGGDSIFVVCLDTYSYSSTGDSCFATSCQDVWIGGNPWDCISWFDYWPDGLTIDFNGYILNGLPGDFFWEFGDGSSGSGQQISHTYAAAGIYVVTLTTTDTTGCTYTSSMEVWVDTYPVFSLYGYVYLENGIFADDATVRLMTTDSLWQNVVEVASTTINDSGFYQLDSIPLNNFQLYFVQAELNQGSAWYGQYLPTYHLSALTWQEAMPVLPIPNWTTDILMIPATTLNAGTGSIYGNVTHLGTREALENVEVILMNESMEPYTYVRSDENGEFRFEDLAYGNYMIHAEMMGMNTTPALISLHEGQPESEVEIQVTGGEVNYMFSVTERLISLSGVSQAYPNPTTGISRIEFTAREALSLSLDIYNPVGQLTWSASLDLGPGTQQVALPMRQFPAGFYYLKATSDEGDFVTRRIVKQN